MGTIFVDNIKDNVGGKEVNIGDGSLNVASDGSVGVRTTSPSDNLEITPSADEKGLTLKTTANIRPYLNFDANRSGAGNNLAHINFKWNGTDVARIIGVAGADTTNKDDAHITFQTASAGSPAERMRIDSSGNILVGKTSSDGSAAGHEMRPTSFAIHTRDNGAPLGVRRIGSGTNDEGNYIFFENASADVGQIGYVSTGFFIQGESSHSGFRFGGNQIVPFRDGSDSDDTTDLGASGTRFDDIFATNTSISSSDANKKNTITDSDLGLDFINNLSPKSYIFNGKTRVHYGLIAQEVENVLSDINKPTSKFAGFVKDEKENFYGLRYAEFISPMIQAIKDLKAEVDTLKDKVKELESK